LDFNIFEKYNYIWCSHVVEHLRNPGIFFDKVYFDLAENGWVGITVPPLKNDMTFQHVTLWNAGFDCTNARVAKYGYNITVIAQKLPRGDKPMPKCLPPVNRRGIYFDGDIERLNWSEDNVPILETYSNFKIKEIAFPKDEKSQFYYFLDANNKKRIYYFDSSSSDFFLTG
jgi:hypothetical protein